jgi:zinc protease
MMMLKRILTATLLVALVIPACLPAQGAEPPTVLIPKSGSGAVRVRIMFAAGSAYDPAGKEGLADFVGGALRRGSKQYSRAAIDDRLDALAAQINIEVDRDVAIVEGRCLAEAWPEFAKLYLSVLTEPAFDSVEMVRLVDDQLDAIEQIRRDDGTLAKAALQYFLYENHPYGHPTEGLTHTVKTITSADARSFYESHYTSGDYILGLAGEVTEPMAQSIRQSLAAALKAGTPPPLTLPMPKVTGLNVYLIEKENRAQTQLRFGRPIDIGRSDADFMPLFLANTWLGRHRESMGRLYQVVRSQRGLSYGAYSYAEHFDQDGWSNLARPGRPRQEQYFSAWVYPKATNANFVIHVVMRELADLSAKGLAPNDLEAARTFEINHFPFEIETPARLLGMRMDEIYLHTPAFVDGFTKAAQQVTVDDVQRATRRAIDVNNMAVVAVVSNGAEFTKQLLEGPVTCEYPSGVDPKSLSAEDAPYQNYKLPLTPDKIRVIKADEMFR